ncbi:MAG: aminoacyl-tRNA hydrolase [Terrimonas sp.]|nr:aminoacyl-tRNA hydrolase [Terrimonas sp.]
MTTIDLKNEILFQTTRSGGKGGQNVNKVETAVIGSFPVLASKLLNDEQKSILLQQLSNRINKEGELQVKAQTFRTQLENKEEVIRKLQTLVVNALRKKKKRIATKASKASREKRLEGKKKESAIKAGRKKLKPGEY